MKKTVYEFVELMKRLRAPGGCPWDREQTHDSIKMNLLEEAYEAFDAIDDGDDAKTMDELGDLLMQIVFHAMIAEEEGKYDLDDVAGNVYEKMIRRHPHVFGENMLDKSSDVLVKWEKIKSVEKGYTSYAQDLYDVVRALPALMRSDKLLKRAAKAGLSPGTTASLCGELQDICEALTKEEATVAYRAEELVGDMLFTAAALSRALHVQPELALEEANKRFIKRFAKMEQLYDGGDDFAAIDDDTRQRLWEKAQNVL